jgi:hypothetical protein
VDVTVGTGGGRYRESLRGYVTIYVTPLGYIIYGRLCRSRGEILLPFMALCTDTAQI